MINSLRIEGFRNIGSAQLEFAEGVNLFYGPNGAGKTNLLEALGLYSLGKSCRGADDKAMVGFERSLAEISALIENQKRKAKITIRISASGIRKIVVDGHKSIKQSELVGASPAVFIFPEDLELTSGPANYHRQFLDLYISQYNRDYLDSLFSYRKVVLQRNKLLRDISQSGKGIQQLKAWDKLLVDHGAKIIGQRNILVESIAGLASGYYRDFDDRSELSLIYNPKIAANEDNITKAMEQLLEDYRQREQRAGLTLVGPHRDRLEIEVNGRSMRHYGSRGQKRCAMIAMKLAAADHLSKIKDEHVTLALDEAFAEIVMSGSSFPCIE